MVAPPFFETPLSLFIVDLRVNVSRVLSIISEGHCKGKKLFGAKQTFQTKTCCNFYYLTNGRIRCINYNINSSLINNLCSKIAEKSFGFFVI